MTISTHLSLADDGLVRQPLTLQCVLRKQGRHDLECLGHGALDHEGVVLDFLGLGKCLLHGRHDLVALRIPLNMDF